MGPFAPPLQQAIHALKYGGLRVLAPLLAELLAEYWQSSPLAVEVIVPVPLHSVRERRRGYNQSVLLAEELSKRVHVPVCNDALVRRRNTPPQVSLSRAERRQNVQRAFAVGQAVLAGRRVLLLDDVLTTGATLDACAAPLLEAGAHSVWALTLARATLSERGRGGATLETAQKKERQPLA
jgi:ComF family protein